MMASFPYFLFVLLLFFVSIVCESSPHFLCVLRSHKSVTTSTKTAQMCLFASSTTARWKGAGIPQQQQQLRGRNCASSSGVSFVADYVMMWEGEVSVGVPVVPPTNTKLSVQDTRGTCYSLDPLPPLFCTHAQITDPPGFFSHRGQSRAPIATTLFLGRWRESEHLFLVGTFWAPFFGKTAMCGRPSFPG